MKYMQQCQFMKMVGGPRLVDLVNLPSPIFCHSQSLDGRFFSSDFGHFILRYRKKFKEVNNNEIK